MSGCLSIIKGTSNQSPRLIPIRNQLATSITAIAPSSTLLSKSICQLPPIPCPEPIPKPKTHDQENCYVKNPHHQSPFMRLLQAIINYHPGKLRDPLVRFDLSMDAAIHNKNVLESVNNSVESLIQACSPSILNYGSEFKPVSVLHPLLHRHKNWTQFKRLLQHGSKFPLESISEEDRVKDFKEALNYGNHRSAVSNHRILMKTMTKESQRGWVLPLLPDHASQLTRATMSPMGIVTQSTINEKGEIIPSNRVTHDLSFPGKFSYESINSRTQMKELSPCQYGHMLLRCIHYIVQLRIANPNLPIVMQKADFKSAYRRVHLNAATASQCMSQIKHPDHPHIVLLPLRLTFGGSACPSEWCVVSELITDLANRILNHEHWHTDIVRPSLADKVPPTEVLSNEIPFAQGRPTLMADPSILEETGRADVYVDDICTIGPLHNKEAEEKLRMATLLAIEAVGRPNDGTCPSASITRENLVSLDKLHAEAGLSETKILLGWELDTRRLTVKLTQEKYDTWTKQIRDILASNGKTTKKVLESLIGRLNHAATIVPTARHFLSRLYRANSCASKYLPIHLNTNAINDLELWLNILTTARSGISMNLLTFRPPNTIYWSDACEYGLGGYSSHGLAWRWKIPLDLQQRAHINLLEFLAETICIWIDILKGQTKQEDCILCFGDSTTAMGWLHRSNFRHDEESIEIHNAKTMLARQLAMLILNYRIKLYSQWLQGQRNGLADALSRDDSTLTDHELTNYLLSSFPSQVPNNFEIHPLPQEIVSFISKLLLQLPKRQPRPPVTKNSAQGPGTDGLPSPNPSPSKTIPSSSHLPSIIAQKSSVSLPNPYVLPQMDQPEEVCQWLKDQSEIPSACWRRPSWKTMFQIHD
jgi:hypothetical protein